MCTLSLLSMAMFFYEDTKVGRINIKLTITGVTIILYILNVFATIIVLVTVESHVNYDFSRPIQESLLKSFSLMNQCREDQYMGVSKLEPSFTKNRSVLTQAKILVGL